MQGLPPVTQQHHCIFLNTLQSATVDHSLHKLLYLHLYPPLGAPSLLSLHDTPLEDNRPFCLQSCGNWVITKAIWTADVLCIGCQEEGAHERHVCERAVEVIGDQRLQYLPIEMIQAATEPLNKK